MREAFAVCGHGSNRGHLGGLPFESYGIEALLAQWSGRRQGFLEQEVQRGVREREQGSGVLRGDGGEVCRRQSNQLDPAFLTGQGSRERMGFVL